MGLFFKNKHFDYQALRAIATAPVGQADICEITSTCNRIKNGDCISWCAEWKKTADRIRKFGVLLNLFCAHPTIIAQQNSI